MGHAGLGRGQLQCDTAARRQRQHKAAQRPQQQRGGRHQRGGGAGQQKPQRRARQGGQIEDGGGHGQPSRTWGIFTALTISAVTSAALSRWSRALALSTRRWQHTSSNTAATSSGIT